MQTSHLTKYLLHLADNALVLGHRNSEYCGHGPVLEQDIALTNISLDLLGQARNFYQYAANILNATELSPLNKEAQRTEVTEDSLAYLRTEREYLNCLLAEQPNGDWGQTILRQFFLSAFQYFIYQQLQFGKDAQLAAIAAKSLKEVTYHLRWSSEWVIRLGDGTTESRERMLQAVDALWMYTGELFMPAPYEKQLLQQGIGVDLASVKISWQQKIADVLEEATLPVPVNVFMHSGGKQGIHTEYMGYILAELQYMQRAYPNCKW